MPKRFSVYITYPKVGKSLKLYTFAPATHKELLEVVKWCQNHLSLRDWEIVLVTTESPPHELAGSLSENATTCGMSAWSGEDEEGIIWLPLKRLEALNVSPIVTCVHEVLHCVTGKVGLENDEYLVSLLSPLVYEAYLNVKSLPKVFKARGISGRRKISQRRETR